MTNLQELMIELQAMSASPLSWTGTSISLLVMMAIYDAYTVVHAMTP